MDDSATIALVSTILTALLLYLHPEILYWIDDNFGLIIIFGAIVFWIFGPSGSGYKKNP